MNKQTIRDRFWLWGMKVNALQSTEAYAKYAKIGLGESTMTVEQAIQRTGVKNVVMAGNLPINQESLDAIPS